MIKSRMDLSIIVMLLGTLLYASAMAGITLKTSGVGSIFLFFAFFVFGIGCVMYGFSVAKERFFGKALTLKDIRKNCEIEVVEKLRTDNNFAVFINRIEEEGKGSGDNKFLTGLESRFEPGDCFKVAKQKISGEEIFTAIRTKTKIYDR